MEDLLSCFGNVEVTTYPNNPNAEHPRFALYKPKFSGSSQEERRKKVLEARREARYDLLSHLRSIEDTGQGQDDTSDDMECDQERRCYRRPAKYKQFLMLSEWLVDVPKDFVTTYFTLPCPVGKRALIVSNKGGTRSFTKSGYQVKQFPSWLPGGNRHNCNTGSALLDCIWSEIDKTFYVIDVMCWVNQSIIECDTFFRFEWLRSRFDEADGIDEISKYNPYRFKRLPYYDSSPETLSRLFNKDELPFSVELDGILFYNRDTHYTHGPTPLIGWLKAYMLPEILGVNVAEKYMAERPAKYTNLPAQIKDDEEMKKQRKGRSPKMDVTPETVAVSDKAVEMEEAEKIEANIS